MRGRVQPVPRPDKIYPNHASFFSAGTLLVRFVCDNSEMNRLSAGGKDMLMRSNKCTHLFPDCQQQTRPEIFFRGHRGHRQMTTPRAAFFLLLCISLLAACNQVNMYQEAIDLLRGDSSAAASNNATSSSASESASSASSGSAASVSSASSSSASASIGTATLAAYYWLDEQEGILASTSGSLSLSRGDGDTLAITASGGGYTNQQWFVNGAHQAAADGSPTFEFSSAGRPDGEYRVDLFVEKGGRNYSVSFTVVVMD